MAGVIARRTFKIISHHRCLKSFQGPQRQFSLSKIISNRVYTPKHEWISIEGKVGTVGISNHAQDALGEIVYVETPEVGAELAAEDVAGCLESVKAASDVYSPVAGVVSEVNEELADNPALVNKSPLDKGWLYKMIVDSSVDTSALMDEGAYTKYLETLVE